jgi:hypothetical protein
LFIFIKINNKTAMKGNRLNNPSRISKTITCLLFTAIFLFACRKKDLPLPEKTATDHFFQLPPGADITLERCAAELRRQNQYTGLVNKMILADGFPRWKNAWQQKPGTKTDRTIIAGADTIVLIPLVMEGSNRVSSIIEMRLNGSITTRLFRSRGYQSQLNGSAASGALTAERFAILFMQAEQEVFGYRKFTITDPLLFRKEMPCCNKPTSFLKLNMGRAAHALTEQSGGDCYEVEIWYDPDGDADPDHNSGNEYFTGETYWVGDCSESSGGGVFPGGFGGLGGGSPVLNGGLPAGSGGGGGSGGAIPCQGSNLLVNGQLPCDTLPGLPPVYGWVPAQEDDPCDEFILQLQNDANFTAKFSTLNAPGVLSLNYEKGFVIADRVGNHYLEVEGSAGSSIIYFNNLQLKIDGFLHSHYNRLSSMFSPLDLILMAKVFLGGKAKDSSNLFFGVTSSYGMPYLIKITNTAKFRAFAEEIAGDDSKIKNFSKKYDPKFNFSDPDLNETGFLKMLEKMKSGNGLTLFRGNNDCTKWTKLTIDNFDAIQQNDCL